MRLSEKSRPTGRLFDYITVRRMSLRVLLMMVMKRAPSAPSITRWSKDREIGIIRRGTNSLPFHTGSIADLDTPRIATSGAFTIGAKWVVPKAADAGDSEAAALHFAGSQLTITRFLEMVVSSRDSSVMLFLFTSLKTGTTRPFGVSTATPMLMYFFSVSFGRLRTGSC